MHCLLFKHICLFHLCCIIQCFTRKRKWKQVTCSHSIISFRWCCFSSTAIVRGTLCYLWKIGNRPTSWNSESKNTIQSPNSQTCRNDMLRWAEPHFLILCLRISPVLPSRYHRSNDVRHQIKKKNSGHFHLETCFCKSRDPEATSLNSKPHKQSLVWFPWIVADV